MQIFNNALEQYDGSNEEYILNIFSKHILDSYNWLNCTFDDFVAKLIESLNDKIVTENLIHLTTLRFNEFIPCFSCNGDTKCLICKLEPHPFFVKLLKQFRHILVGKILYILLRNVGKFKTLSKIQFIDKCGIMNKLFNNNATNINWLASSFYYIAEFSVDSFKKDVKTNCLLKFREYIKLKYPLTFKNYLKNYKKDPYSTLIGINKIQKINVIDNILSAFKILDKINFVKDIKLYNNNKIIKHCYIAKIQQIMNDISETVILLKKNGFNLFNLYHVWNNVIYVETIFDHIKGKSFFNFFNSKTKDILYFKIFDIVDRQLIKTFLVGHQFCDIVSKKYEHDLQNKLFLGTIKVLACFFSINPSFSLICLNTLLVDKHLKCNRIIAKLILEAICESMNPSFSGSFYNYLVTKKVELTQENCKKYIGCLINNFNNQNMDIILTYCYLINYIEKDAKYKQFLSSKHILIEKVLEFGGCTNELSKLEFIKQLQLIPSEKCYENLKNIKSYYDNPSYIIEWE